MTEDKLRKMITGATVAATLIIFVFLAILVYQWVTMGVQARREREAQARYEANQQIANELGSELGYFQSELGKIDEAMQDGWTFEEGN